MQHVSIGSCLRLGVASPKNQVPKSLFPRFCGLARLAYSYFLSSRIPEFNILAAPRHLIAVIGRDFHTFHGKSKSQDICTYTCLWLSHTIDFNQRCFSLLALSLKSISCVLICQLSTASVCRTIYVYYVCKVMYICMCVCAVLHPCG